MTYSFITSIKMRTQLLKTNKALRIYKKSIFSEIGIPKFQKNVKLFSTVSKNSILNDMLF